MGFTMNAHGMSGAAGLMQRHAAAMGITYAAAMRLRLDAGTPHGKSRHGFPGWGTWQILRTHVENTLLVSKRAKATSGAGHRQLLFSCHPKLLPGAPWGDNCLWSLPAAGLARTLDRLAEHLDDYLPPAALRMTQSHPTWPVDNITAALAAQDIFIRCPAHLRPAIFHHAEAAVGCAAADNGIALCPLLLPKVRLNQTDAPSAWEEKAKRLGCVF
jgi:hypothetical protein